MALHPEKPTVAHSTSPPPQPGSAMPMAVANPGTAPNQAPRPANIYDTVAHMPGDASPAMSSPMYPSQPAQTATASPYPLAPPMTGRHDLRPSHDAARMASPVGDGHLAQVDWAEAAAMPVRVVPPWALALLFVAAKVVALGVTFAVAAIIR